MRKPWLVAIFLVALLFGVGLGVLLGPWLCGQGIQAVLDDGSPVRPGWPKVAP
jgi:hypothetical protein